MKTNELKGHALNWAVHVALHGSCEGYAEHEYSTDWAHGGPIIEREGISVMYRTGVRMIANINGQYEQTIGHLHKGNIGLLVAMRCYVASKLGDEVEIPKELT